MDNYNYVWFIRNSEDRNRYYFELEKKKNVRFIFKNQAFSSAFINMIFRLSFSIMVNRHLKMPWKQKLLDLIYNSIKFGNDKHIIFVFSQGWYDKAIIKWMKRKHPEIMSVLYCDDTIECFANEIPGMQPEMLGNEFDLVLCYNPGDVKKYGYTPTNVCLSKHIDLGNYFFKETDLSFIGQAKDRNTLLREIKDYLEGKCTTDFLLVGDADLNNGAIPVSEKYLDYKEYLSRECAANCILELVKGDTEGATLRCWEAVYYNKKLLTNWKGLFDFEFYDSRYMQFFEKPEDIDINFLTDRVAVNYQYYNQNSPELFLERIGTLIHMKEKIKKYGRK